MSISSKFLIYIFILLLSSVSFGAIEFNRDIRPILSGKCFECHGPDANHRKAGLRLDTREGAVSDNDGIKAIDLDNLSESEILFRIQTEDSEEIMPPPDSKKLLSEKEKALITEWIKGGGEYQDHWAFEKVKESEPPKIDNINKSDNPIDAFIVDRLNEVGLSPMNEAGKEILIRRVKFDLTGLPPTREEVDQFLADNSPDAYEKMVDRIMKLHSYLSLIHI